jgi:gag-polypeptide of LTR copia-type
MSEEGASKLPELKSDNYTLWSRKINAYLRQHLLFNLVHDLEPRPASNATKQQEWDNKQMKAAGVIEQSLDESNASHCEGLFGDATAMWKKLEQIHNAKTPGTRFNAMHSLFSIRKEEDETLESLMTRTKAAMQRVKTLRPTIPGAYTLEMLDNELVIATLLQALPDTFNHVTSSLYIQSELDLEMVERSFRSEDVHRKQQAASDPVSALRAFTPHHTRSSSVPNPPRQNSNNRPWCEHCQSNTHWESRCWHKNPSLRPRRFNTRTQGNAANANTAETNTAETHASNASTYPPPEARSN